METLWVPVSYLGFKDWTSWETPSSHGLSCTLDIGGLVSTTAAFSFQNDRLCIHDSLREIGDQPADFKTAKRDVPPWFFGQAVYDALEWAFETGLREQSERFFAHGLPLPGDFQGWPEAWGGKSLWLPFSHLHFRARGQLRRDTTLWTWGDIRFDRFLKFFSADLMSQEPLDQPALGVLQVTSTALRKWTRDAFERCGADQYAGGASQVYELADPNADPLEPIHLGYSPPVKVSTSEGI